MRKIRLLSTIGGIEVLKLVTTLVLLISLLTVIHDHHALFRVNRSVVWLFLLSAVVIATLVIANAKGAQRRLSSLSLFLLGSWSIGVALILPSSTPLIVINPFLVLITATYLSQRQLVLGVAMLIVGVEISFLTADDLPVSRLIFVGIHTLSLVLIGALAIWYKHSLVSLVESNQRKHIQTNLEHERLQSLVNSMTDGVVAIDSRGLIAVYNGAALDILNINASLENQSITDYLTFFDAQGKRVPIIKNVLKDKGYLVSRDYLLDVGDGERINVYLTVSPVRVGFGQKGGGGFIIMLRDITHEKSLEEERDEFISVVSHELRTPTAVAEGSISNSLFLAKKANSDAEVIQSLNEAHKQVVFLADMVNDLATLSRAEQNKLQVEPEDIDVHEFVNGLQRDYQTDAQQKGIEFTVSVGKNVKQLHSSRLYVREILQNFITNALKYTDQGKVQLKVSLTKDRRIEFAVHDSGIGVSKADQKLLFNKFFRSEDYRTRKNSGTGLGLYVTAKLARLIRADVSVKSELDHGSVFTVRVPSLQRKPTRKSRKSKTVVTQK